jgi:hypothetical protein
MNQQQFFGIKVIYRFVLTGIRENLHSNGR